MNVYAQIISDIEKYEAYLDKEFQELCKFSLTLDHSDRDGYIAFSIKQRQIRLRLERRIAHRQEEYEICAAINRHLKKLGNT